MRTSEKCLNRIFKAVISLFGSAWLALAHANPVDLPNPAPSGSQFPHLHVSNDALYMSWLATLPESQTALQFARWQNGKWSPVQEIARGADWFVNWADFPSLTVLKDGTLAAHWLQKSAPDSYAYDVRLSFSRDQGQRWSSAQSPHDDGTKTEHGFVTLLPRSDGDLSMVWLDGRATAQAAHAGHGSGGANATNHGEEQMQLRHARFNRDGVKQSEQAIDSDTCTCCQTTAVLHGDAMVAAYRDHAPGEIRDIAFVRMQAEKWMTPAIVHADQWEIPGCPVNGPALASSGKHMAIAWYTGAQLKPRVQLALARADISGFHPPVQVAGGEVLGRVALTAISEQAFVVSWLERAGEQSLLRVQRHDVLASGQLAAGKVHDITRFTNGRGSGFPRLAQLNGELIIAWTEPQATSPSQVRVARLPLTAL